MRCKFCKVWIVTIAIIFLSFLIAYQFVEPPPPKEIGIATGREGGGYYKFSLQYQKLIAKEGFELNIQPTAGSIEVLQKLKSGEVSVGLVQGGTAKEVEGVEGLQSLASLFYEPVWVFHRKDLPIKNLFDLRGKRIAVGENGSGTKPLAMQLLDINHVTSDNSTLLNISSKQAAEKLVAGEIDAAFFVTSPKATVITELLTNSKIDLLSFRRYQAYSSRYPFLTHVEIGEGMIDLENNIPHKNKILLAATASLVARKDLHSDLIQLLLKSLIKVHKNGGMLEKQDQFPSNKFVEFPINSKAEHYLISGPSLLEKIFPFWLATSIDRLKIMLIPLIAILLPLFKGVLPIYNFTIRYKIFRWYEELREIDEQIHDLTDINIIDEKIERLKSLQKELIQQVSVPLSYMGEFYGLRMHIKLVLERLQERRAELV
jgi:TRAP transporter TAXI family solute receptor